jgi:murein L,D-transpeptidase YcbB/YkuD
MRQTFKLNFVIFAVLFYGIVSCKNKHVGTSKPEVFTASEIDEALRAYIPNTLTYASEHAEKINDSLVLHYLPVLKRYYENYDNNPVWSSEKKWKGNANALMNILEHASLLGLYKEDYHFNQLVHLKSYLDKDSLKKASQVEWGNTELLMTDAFVGLLKDLKQGRLYVDSLSWKYDTSKYKKYFFANLEKARAGEIMDSILESVQPQHEGYKLLKSGIKKFVDSMDTHVYTYVGFPYKDSLAFVKSLRKRLGESGIILSASADSLAFSEAIKKYQKKVGLVVDGKVGAAVVKRLNLNDVQRFNSIAITLDRYKLLPEKMPKNYIWVNLPAYYLKVKDADTTALESRIICGKPTTPTPILTSQISDIVLYPTWTVPTSIISKDMLPGLKRNSNYLARRGLYLLNGKGARINPSTINWNKYSKGIPFRIQQGSGDGNALGIIKFNFNNPFSVYLHDTNQRYLFKNAVRCLSHGCVRVQEWQKLADYIIRNDSINLKPTDTLKYNTDSIRNWLAVKQNRKLDVQNKVPLFIRYFSCELVNGTIKFYDDIYADDRDLKLKYFAKK